MPATRTPGVPVTTNAAGDIVWKNTGIVGEVIDPQTGAVLLPGQAIVSTGGVATNPNNDRTGEISATADLSTLAADGTDGDGNFGGGTFATGEYVVLDDFAVANYDGANWQSGVA